MVNWISGLVSTTTPFPFHNWPSFTPWIAEVAEAEIEPLVLASVLLSLIVVYLAAKVGGELCARINLPPCWAN